VLPAGSYETDSSRVTDAVGNTMTGPAIFNFIWTGGTAGADTFRIAVNAAGTTTQVYQNNDVTPAFTANYASLGEIFIDGGEGDDTFIVDTSNGNPYALSGIVLGGATEPIR